MFIRTCGTILFKFVFDSYHEVFISQCNITKYLELNRPLEVMDKEYFRSRILLHIKINNYMYKYF